MGKSSMSYQRDHTTADQSRQPLTERLSPEHIAMLREGSCISDEIILARGYRTVRDKAELLTLGFKPAQSLVPGLLLPLWTTDGQNSVFVYRPDAPRSLADRAKGKLDDGTYPRKLIKYEYPAGASMRLDCPPSCRPALADPRVDLFITEGQKKADALASKGLCAVSLLGVWNFKGKNAFGGNTVLADWDYVALTDARPVHIVFDSDIQSKPQVRLAAERLTEHLKRRGANTSVTYLPPGPAGEKQGVDDFFAAGHTVEELVALAEAPHPTPRAAPATVEFLDEAPAAIRRPLTLLGDHSYAATWLYVRTTVREKVSKDGVLLRLDPPEVTTKHSLVIIRSDGTVFGPGHESFDDLGVEVVLPEVLPPDKVWSAAGVKRYAAGHRPDPVEVFQRSVAVTDHFIDFDRSLADQLTMAELSACYELATYFLDAFQVIAYFWAAGGYASGKTQLLNVICLKAYLGEVSQASSTFATLRDLADYGAALAFDDLQELGEKANRMEPDVRALLLAGNRRGTTISLKEADGNGGWRTRFVHVYCPRLFSATDSPDPILASRAIMVPLIRTADKKRANRDASKLRSWPHDRRRLVDDMWALGVGHLPRMGRWDEWVEENAPLAGRALEPWRAIFAVAKWLDEHDRQGLLVRATQDDTGDRILDGLYGRMVRLAKAYQQERAALATPDLTLLAIYTLARLVDNDLAKPSTADTDDSRDGNDTKNVGQQKFRFENVNIRVKAVAVSGEMDMGFSEKDVTSDKLGRKLAELRLQRYRTASERGWVVTLADLARWSLTYGLVLPDHVQKRVDDTVQPDPSVSVTGVNGVMCVTADPSAASDTESTDDLLEGII
jgi:hypothetical protein